MARVSYEDAMAVLRSFGYNPPQPAASPQIPGRFGGFGQRRLPSTLISSTGPDDLLNILGRSSGTRKPPPINFASVLRRGGTPLAPGVLRRGLRSGRALSPGTLASLFGSRHVPGQRLSDEPLPPIPPRRTPTAITDVQPTHPTESEDWRYSAPYLRQWGAQVGGLAPYMQRGQQARLKDMLGHIAGQWYGSGNLPYGTNAARDFFGSALRDLVERRIRMAGESGRPINMNLGLGPEAMRFITDRLGLSYGKSTGHERAFWNLYRQLGNKFGGGLGYA